MTTQHIPQVFYGCKIRGSRRPTMTNLNTRMMKNSLVILRSCAQSWSGVYKRLQDLVHISLAGEVPSPWYSEVLLRNGTPIYHHGQASVAVCCCSCCVSLEWLLLGLNSCHPRCWLPAFGRLQLNACSYQLVFLAFICIPTRGVGVLSPLHKYTQPSLWDAMKRDSYVNVTQLLPSPILSCRGIVSLSRPDNGRSSTLLVVWTRSNRHLMTKWLTRYRLATSCIIMLIELHSFEYWLWIFYREHLN